MTAPVPAEFACRRCGNCCRHAGEVRLAAGEVEAIAAVLGLDPAAFTDRYTRLRDDRRGLVLVDRPDGACIFLEDEGPPRCRIQAAKPRQCRDFPIGWRYENLAEVCKSASA